MWTSRIRSSIRRLWAVYGAGALLVVVGLWWASTTVLAIEARQRVADAASRHAQELRLALWQMDSLLLPLLSREAARPAVEYEAYHAQPGGGEPMPLWIPSPLLSAQPEYVRLHFEVDEEGTFRSPQIPEGHFQEVAVIGCFSELQLPPRQDELGRIAALVDRDAVRNRMLAAEGRMTALMGESIASHALPPYRAGEVPQSGINYKEPGEQNRAEYTARLRNSVQATQWAQREADNQFRNIGGNTLETAVQPVTLSVGMLVPLWLGAEQNELFCFRRVTRDGIESLQGVYFDWPRLRDALLTQVEGLLIEPGLRPGPPAASSDGLALASIPATLQSTPAAIEPVPFWNAAHVSLSVAWAAIFCGLIAVAVSLHKSITHGERRSRFASSVTHELRTPLTTFRMYSEMLADDMVPADKRQNYLRTLKDESNRLATLVENVLSYARVEDGRNQFHRERLPAAALVDRVLPPLKRRCDAADMAFRVEGHDRLAGIVDTDVEGLGQVLVNLVDNACKYAREGVAPAVELRIEERARELAIRVSDRGPGISAGHDRLVFQPFERADHDGDATPGVGLGLALARGLARDLGGDLVLCTAAVGACFEVTVPLVP